MASALPTFLVLIALICKASRAGYAGDYASMDEFRATTDLVDSDSRSMTFLKLIGVNEPRESLELIGGTKKSLRKRHPRTSVCDLGCKCNQTEVVCDFANSPNLPNAFDSNLFVPKNATKLIIDLSPDTRFYIERGFFSSSSRINRLTITGGLQVDIKEESLRRIGGVQPEIKITGCEFVMLRANAFNTDFKIMIKNTNEVVVRENAFSNSWVNGSFENINELIMEERAFSKAQAWLNFSELNIIDLRRFGTTKLRQVRFTKCHITTVNENTFGTPETENIIFRQCVIETIKSRAIGEGNLSANLRINDGTIGLLESQAIGGGISYVNLSGNVIDTIEPAAINVTSVSITIADNRIKYLHNKWLVAQQSSKIEIKNNTFGDYGRIDIDGAAEPPNQIGACSFQDNLISNPKQRSLDLPKKCSYNKNRFDHACTCNMRWLQTISNRDLESESYCSVDALLTACFNATHVTYRAYDNVVCNQNTHELNCMKNRDHKQIDGTFFSSDELNNSDKKRKLVYTLCGIGVLAILVVFVIVMTSKCVQRNKKNAEAEPSVGGVETTNHGHPWGFSKEDRRIIVQTLEMMKSKYPAAYEKVFSSTQLLFDPNLQEAKRLQTVDDILNELEKCPNKADFVAFNYILDQQLRLPSEPTAPPMYPPPMYPKYALPTEPMIEMHTQTPLSPATTTHLNNDLSPYGSTSVVNHIYAELGNPQQQPLLRNEYASPTDRDDIVSHLYSDPVGPNAVATQIKIAPYAVGKLKPPTIASPYAQSVIKSIQQQQQQPSTSQNLPDVLNSSPLPSTSEPRKPNIATVRKALPIPKSFSNNQNFHITRSPTTNRKIPKYTIPNKATNEQIANFEQIYEMAGAGASALPPSSDAGSNHSGGSDVTVQMDEIIEYVDA